MTSKTCVAPPVGIGSAGTPSRSTKRIAKLFSSKRAMRPPTVLSPSPVSQFSSWSLTFGGSDLVGRSARQRLDDAGRRDSRSRAPRASTVPEVMATTPTAATSPERAASERRPVIVAVDDEPAVLAAVARDLRRGFGERFRVMRASSGAEGLDLLKQLRTRGDQVAMLIADQRMPGMQGTDYLVEARKLVPEAKRVLLTAYADTEAAIAAINEVALDYYLLKPWDPPEEQLFPVVEDLLTTWESGAALEAGGVRIVGHRFSKDTHDLRDFLARNRVPARWLDIERDGEARELLTIAGVSADGPAGRAAGGRHGAREADGARARRAARRRRPAGAGSLRPRRRRGRAGRAGRRGLRRVGGAAHGDGRARGARRPGRPVQPDRELPRLPRGPQRLGPRAPRDRPGAAARRGAADGLRRRAPARRGLRPLRRALQRQQPERQLRAHRSAASPTARSTRRASPS